MRQQIEREQVPMQKVTSPPEDSRSIDIQVKRYLIWLLDQALRDQQENQAEIQAYAEQARRIVEAENRQIQIFAPFRYRYSALYTITRPQAVTLILAGLLVFFLPVMELGKYVGGYDCFDHSWLPGASGAGRSISGSGFEWARGREH